MAERFTGYGMPSIDFSEVGQLGDVYQKNRQGATRERVLSDLGKGTLDYGKASQALLAAGDTEGGLSLARLAESRSNRGEDVAFRREEAARHAAESQRDYGLRERQFNAGLEGQKIPPGFESNPDAPGALRPRAGGPADPGYISQTTNAKVPADSLLTDAELVPLAQQLNAGDTSVLTNLSRGGLASQQNVVNLRRTAAKLNAEAGVSGADQAMRNAEFFGTKAGQRTVGTKGANIELAATEFKQVLPVVQEASKAVSRTNYPDLNKIIQSYETRTGDPAIVKFGGGINTLVNLYARAISPSGVGTVSDKEHAREILQKSWSSGQFDAAVGMMQQEIDAALASPEKVRDEMRKRFIGGQQPSGATAPSQGALPQFKSPAEVQRMMQTGKMRSGDKFRDSDGNERTIP